jgi:nucleoside-diphosphate-sugar epimerase
MKSLVTDGIGFTGSLVVDALIRLGDWVREAL